MQIPFEKTIAAAYRFAFRNLLSILGIGWLPALFAFLVMGAVILLLLPDLQALIAQGKKVDPSQVTALLPKMAVLFLGAMVCMLIATSMIYVGTIRKTLGIISGPVYAYFPLDGQTWRVAGAFLTVMIVSWGVMIVAAMAIFVAVAVVGAYSKPGGAVLAGVLVTVGMLAGFYALIRVQFFLPVIAVAENHISLGRSWVLGRRNFWRILGIMVIMVIPLVMAVTIIPNAFLQSHIKPITSSTPPAVILSEMSAALIAIAPLYIVFQLVYFIAVNAFMAIAASAAYRFVTGGESIAPPPPAKA